ncbi:MAG: DUF692 family protein [Fimbriimonadaceae bacterium]|nr:DUF692 family protein [Fimbriimonadaceae bacterium]
MKFAVNWSPSARSLAAEGRIRPDLYKCHTNPDWVAEALAAGPAYCHLPLDLGAPDLAAVDFGLMRELSDRTGTPWWNVHLNAERRLFDRGDEEEIFERWQRNSERIAREAGGRQIVGENVVYRGEDDPWLEPVSDPVLLRNLLEEFSFGFLLDTAHAMITARTLREDPHEFVEWLPVERLVEMHVSGVDLVRGRLGDSMPLTPDDEDLIRRCSHHIQAGAWPKPKLVALEYGGIGPIFDWRSDPETLERDFLTVERLFGRTR